MIRPLRSKTADPEDGDWTCSYPGGSEACPFEDDDCPNCAYLMVGGHPDPEMPPGESNA